MAKFSWTYSKRFVLLIHVYGKLHMLLKLFVYHYYMVIKKCKQALLKITVIWYGTFQHALHSSCCSWAMSSDELFTERNTSTTTCSWTVCHVTALIYVPLNIFLSRLFWRLWGFIYKNTFSSICIFNNISVAYIVKVIL